MKYLVILPALLEDIATPCIESLSPEVKKHTLLIDNSTSGFAHKFDIQSEHHPENLGVSRSWNIGARRVVKEKLDYLIMLSATMVFEEGMEDFLAQLKHPWGVESRFGWHLVAMGRPTFERIGYFDENFYPAYYEDADFGHRLHLAGIQSAFWEEEDKRFPIVEVNARRQGIALTLASGVLHIDFISIYQYFKQKWSYLADFGNHEQREAMYKYPFNNPENPLSYWSEASIEELKARYNIP